MDLFLPKDVGGKLINNSPDVAVGTLISQVSCARPKILYQLIKNVIIQLESELITDLTTIHSFVWFISKKASTIQ